MKCILFFVSFSESVEGRARHALRLPLEKPFFHREGTSLSNRPIILRGDCHTFTILPSCKTISVTTNRDSAFHGSIEKNAINEQ